MEEDFKYSLYNNIYVIDDQWIIFNSLTGNILTTENQDDIRKIESGEVKGLSQSAIKILCEKGMILNCMVDEVKRGTIKNYESMFSNNLHIIIMPTEKCNFRCDYCYENFENGAMSKQTQDSFLRWFAKNASKYEKIVVSWFGGEPLLNIDIIEYLSKKMLEVCHKWGIQYRAFMTTNGYLLTADMLKRLLQYRIVKYQITIDGLEKDHNRLRHLNDGTGTFNVIMKNLCEIKREIKTKTIHFIIRSNLVQETKHIDEYLHYMTERFGEDTRFAFYFRPVGNWEGTQVERIKGSLLNSMNDVYAYIANGNYRLNYEPHWDSLVDGRCYAGQKNCFVLRSTGRIGKCTMLLNDWKNDLGYIDQEGKMIIDFAKAENWMTIEAEKCKSCPKRGSCFGRNCPAKDIMSESGLCGYENRDISAILRLLIKSHTVVPLKW